VSLENDAPHGVRGEIHSKTGSVVQSAHVPPGHLWVPSATMAPMIPYKLICIDETGLRWAVSFQLRSRGTKVELRVSDVENGEFLAPVRKPSFPVRLDKDVRPIVDTKEEAVKAEPHEPYEVVPQEACVRGAEKTAASAGSGDPHDESDEKAFEASRLRSFPGLAEGYTKIPLTSPPQAIDLEQIGGDPHEELPAPKHSGEATVDVKSKTSERKSRCTKGVLFCGLAGAALAGPVGYWVGSSALLAYPLLGAAVGSCCGATTAGTCMKTFQPKKE